ncbi:MAG: ankyrin repeat domain-containing protein [Alphaproteobacteria bacterium]
MAFFTTKNSFLRAVRRGDLDAARKCIADKEKDVYLAATDERGYSALHIASHEANTAMMELLLEAGVSPDVKTAHGETPLHHIAGSYSDMSEVIKLLLKKGATVDSTDNGGRTPLYHAAGNHIGTKNVKTLLEAGAAADAASLLQAIERCEDNAIALLEKGAKPVATDYYGRNAFHLAVARNYARAVDMMLDGGVDINARDTHYGYTPLHLAIGNNHTAMAEKLLDRGADLTVRDSSAKTPLQYAQERGCGAIVHMIEVRTAPPPVAPALKDDGEQWLKLGEDRVAYIGTFPDIGRRLTEIFNFATRERISISENLKSGQESSSAPQSFDVLPEAALQRAMEAYKTLGGKPDAARVFGSKTGLKA